MCFMRYLNMKRTQSLQSMVNKVNHFLETSPDEMVETRKQLASVLESLLHEAKSYKGFNYIYWDKQGFSDWQLAGSPDFPEKEPFIYGPSMDQTRVHYY